MARLNIDYQLLTWEGDILRLKFWARAFEAMKQTGAVFLQNEGKHAGCWVMKIDDAEHGAPRRRTRRRRRRARRSSCARTARVLRRQGHGLPVLEVGCSARLPLSQVRDAHGRRTLWATTSDPARRAIIRSSAPRATYNVIDVRQSYLQKLLKQALTAIGHPQEPNAHHFSYEMVALSHATAKELGFAPRSGFGGREEAVRRSVGPQGPRREGRRPDRSRDRQGAGRSRQRPSELPTRARRSPNRSASPPCATS
jgi:arginyl-tRNA synthetase